MPENKNNTNDHYVDCEPQKHQLHHSNMETKFPVVLAEVDLQKCLFHVTEFTEDVLEIKDVNKRLVITQCRLLLPTKELFIKGYIRKNIRYAAPALFVEQSDCSPEQILEPALSDYLTQTSIQSDIRSHTEKIPFELRTEIKEFSSMPELPKSSSHNEFDFFISQSLPSGFPEKDQMLSSDLTQFHQESKQYYNELPYCELISHTIIEWNEALTRYPIARRRTYGIFGSSGELLQEDVPFRSTDDKIVIDFKLKILQNQQISISSAGI